MIFHLVESDRWEALRARPAVPAAVAASSPVDVADLAGPGPEGFVHCCDEHQIAGVAERFFPAGTRLVAVGVDPTRLAAETRYEEAADRPGERFAHVYGAIPMAAVVEVRSVR